MGNGSIDKENLAKTLSRNSLFTVIYNVWYLGSRLVLTPIILSYVTIEEYGLWSYCFVILSYLATTAFGFNNTYIRYAADYRSRNENEKLNELLSTGLITMSGLSAVILGALWLLVPNLLSLLGIDTDLHDTARLLLLGTAAIFVLNTSLAGFQCVLEGEQRIVLVRKILLVASVIEIALILVFFETGFGVFALLWAFVARLVVTIILCAFFAYRVFPFLRVSVRLYRKEALKAFWGFGNQMNLLGLLALLINSLDRIFITRILHLQAVGIYEIGRKLPNMGLMLPGAVAGTLMPAASHLEGSSQQQRLKQLYLASTRYLMMFSGIPYAFLIFFAPQIIETWVGPGYVEAVYVMQILAVGTFINLFTGIGTACVRGIGKPKYEIQYMILSTLLILATAVPLINRLGLAGGAWAYFIGQTAGSLYFLWRSNRLFEVSWHRFLSRVMPPVVLIFGIGLLAMALCNWFWPWVQPSRWLQLGLLVAVGICYVACSLLAFYLFQGRLFSREEREKISSLPIPGSAGGLWRKLWRTA
jgi:O-antigen/teichoic acid export membrane protein